MSIAFLVLAHNDSAQLRRLLSRLSEHRVFVHIDGKSKLDASDLGPFRHCVIRDRIPVYWAGFSVVDATLKLIETALSAGTDYSKLVLLSGACYPIKPIDRLAEMFDRDGGHNYLRYVDMSSAPHLWAQVSNRHHRDGLLPWQLTSRSGTALLCERALRRCYESIVRPWRSPLTNSPDRAIPRFFHGSTWWAISPECAQFVTEYARTHDGFVRRYRSTFAPDEHFFHTIIGNSRFSDLATGEQEYGGRGVYRTANLHVIHPSLAKWYTETDFNDLAASDRFFVRKVASDVSARLLELIDEELLR